MIPFITAQLINHIHAGAAISDILKTGLILVGMAVAFVVSLIVIKFLMGYIKKHDFTVFGWYRIILGELVILYFAIAGFLA